MKRLIAFILILSLLTPISFADGTNVNSGGGSSGSSAGGHGYYLQKDYMYKITFYLAKSDKVDIKTSDINDFYQFGDSFYITTNQTKNLFNGNEKFSLVNKFDYFRGKEGDLFNYFMMPDALFDDEHFKDLSIDAKVLYGLLLRRMSLSRKNDWLDEENRVYVIYTIEEVMNKFNISKSKAVKILQELDSKKGIGLIEKKRRGLGKASIIYVKNFIIEDELDDEFEEINEEEDIDLVKEIDDELETNEDKHLLNNEESFKNTEPSNADKQRVCPEVLKSDFKKSKNKTSRSSKNELLEVSKTDSSYINNNYINNNNIYPINQSSSIIYNNTKEPEKSENRLMDEYAYYEKLFKQNIDYDRVYADDEFVTEILNIMIDVACTDKKTIRVNGEDKPTEIVRSVFKKIRQCHITYIRISFSETASKINNIRAYLITTIYNSYLTYDSALRMQVNYDCSPKNPLNQ